MRELEVFFLEVSKALEDLQYEETRNFRRRGRFDERFRRSYYEEVGPPYLLLFIENSKRKDLVYEFVRHSVKLSAYSECYWSLLFGTRKGISFQVLPSAERMIEELRELGEKSWKKALSWLKYYAERMGDPKAIVSLLFSSPGKDLMGFWRSIWEEVNFLAILGPKSLGDFLKLSDYSLSFRD